jgi:hypothetical protein
MSSTGPVASTRRNYHMLSMDLAFAGTTGGALADRFRAG